MNIAFAGLRHGHIFVLHEMALRHPEYTTWGGGRTAAGAARQNTRC